MQFSVGVAHQRNTPNGSSDVILSAITNRSARLPERDRSPARNGELPYRVGNANPAVSERTSPEPTLVACHERSRERASLRLTITLFYRVGVHISSPSCPGEAGMSTYKTPGVIIEEPFAALRDLGGSTNPIIFGD